MESIVKSLDKIASLRDALSSYPAATAEHQTVQEMSAALGLTCLATGRVISVCDSASLNGAEVLICACFCFMMRGGEDDIAQLTSIDVNVAADPSGIGLRHVFKDGRSREHSVLLPGLKRLRVNGLSLPDLPWVAPSHLRAISCVHRILFWM